jgi:hypothetical protein
MEREELTQEQFVDPSLPDRGAPPARKTGKTKTQQQTTRTLLKALAPPRSLSLMRGRGVPSQLRMCGVGDI